MSKAKKSAKIKLFSDFDLDERVLKVLSYIFRLI